MKDIWVEVGFVGIHDKMPSDINDQLQINGVNVTLKYAFTLQYNPPGSNVTEGFDYAEFKIVGASNSAPNDLTATFTYETNYPGKSYTVNKYHDILVPNDFVIPSDIPPIADTAVPDDGANGSGGTTDPGNSGGTGEGSGSDPGSDPSSGNAGAIPQSQIDAGVEQLKKGLVKLLSSKYGAGSTYADAVAKTEKLGALLAAHTAKQMGLVKDAIDGKIDSKQLFIESDAAARKLTNDAFKLTNLPKEVKEAVKTVTKIIDIQKTAEGASSAAYDYVTGRKPTNVSGAEGDFDNEVKLKGRIQDDTDPSTQGNQFVFCGDGRDFIKGSGMGEHVSSGGGNDYFEWTAKGYSYGPGHETAIFNGGNGTDTLERKGNMQSIIDLDDPKFHDEMGGGGYAQTEDGYFRMRLISVENAIGDLANDRISGSAKHNVLSGKDGDDTLRGRAGNDVLNGGAGADKLYGGDGKKGMGHDTFAYFYTTDSTVAKAGQDTIYDFAHGDRFDLSAIDANGKAKGDPEFVFIGTAKFGGHKGELRYEKLKSDTYVYADTDGNKKADFAFHLDDAVKLVKADFLL